MLDITGNGLRYDVDPTHPGSADEMCHAERYTFASLFVRPGSIVVDYGCGTGYGSQIVRYEPNITYLGIEADAAVVEHARTKYGADRTRFVVGDVTRKAPGPHNVGLAFELIEHLKPVPSITVQCLAQRASEVFVFSVPYNERPGNNKHHQHFELTEASFPHGIYWYYQTPDARISSVKSNNVQNLIGVFHQKSVL